MTTPFVVENLFHTLKEIGLSVKEANTYLALVAIHTNPASTIAKRAGLNRCSCYTILERLIQKGFVQKVIREKVTYYTPVDLKYILDHLKNKQSDLENKIETLDTAIEQFELSKKGTSSKPKVIFYEGDAAIQNILEDRLNAEGIIRVYGSIHLLEALFPKYLPGFYKRRIQKNIYVKAIYPANEYTHALKKRDPQELRQSRLIPREFDFHLHLSIYADKVAMTSLGEKFGVLIESKEMAEAYSKIFDFIWASTKKYDDIITRMNKVGINTSTSIIDTKKAPE